MSKIYLDPGHGGSDSGAVGLNNILEKNLNLPVALKVRDLLQSAGFEVKLSRTNDTFSSIEDRTNDANAYGADIFISIHHNAGGGKGYEIYHSVHEGKGHTLANDLSEQYAAIGRLAHGDAVKTKEGSHGDYFGVIRETNMPAVLSEFAFMDTDDINCVLSDAGKQAEAEAIFKGICKFFGTSAAPQPSTPATLSQPVQTTDLVALADAVIAGKYGNGDARKTALGSNYDAVQAIVNEKLGISSSAPAPVSAPSPSPSSGSYVVVTPIPGFVCADDAKNHNRQKNTVQPGTYSIFNEAEGMVNITSQTGTPGNWINPSDNVTGSSQSSRKVVWKTVTNGNYNVRKGPGTQYGIVTSVGNGTQLEGFEDLVDGWFELTNGKYISNQAFSNSGSSSPVYKIITIKGGTWWLHTGPSINAPKITTISGGASYPLLGKSGNWYQIKVGGTIGYIGPAAIA
jgi:hypothetical protein